MPCSSSLLQLTINWSRYIRFFHLAFVLPPCEILGNFAFDIFQVQVRAFSPWVTLSKRPKIVNSSDLATSRWVNIEQYIFVGSQYRYLRVDFEAWRSADSLNSKPTMVIDNIHINPGRCWGRLEFSSNCYWPMNTDQRWSRAEFFRFELDARMCPDVLGCDRMCSDAIGSKPDFQPKSIELPWFRIWERKFTIWNELNVQKMSKSALISSWTEQPACFKQENELEPDPSLIRIQWYRAMFINISLLIWLYWYLSGMISALFDDWQVMNTPISYSTIRVWSLAFREIASLQSRSVLRPRRI